jgi:hypothetical protein
MAFAAPGEYLRERRMALEEAVAALAPHMVVHRLTDV